MKEANERRVNRTIKVFGFISALLSLELATLIAYNTLVAKEFDQHDPLTGDLHLQFWVRLPFSIAIALFALIQLFASFSIFTFNSQSHTTKSIYYTSLMGIMMAFAIGVYCSIEASEYNAITRPFPKHSTSFPSIMPFYWFLQIGACTSLLFVLPMMLFVFYHKLDNYLELQRKQRQQHVSESNLQGWCLALFLLQAASNIAALLNLYDFAIKQNKTNYALDNAVDNFSFYMAVSFIVEVVAISIQLRNLSSPFLTKSQNIYLAVVVGMFQMGTLFIYAVKGSQIFVKDHVLRDQPCTELDCDAERVLKWELIGYGAFNLICILLQLAYLKLVSSKWDHNMERDTLITSEDAV